MTTPRNDYLTMNDAELVIAAKQGNDQAFSELYSRHRLNCFNVANSILGNVDDAEEEVQNSFSSVYRNIRQFQQDALFTTWLNRIVTNQCLMRIRSTKRKRLFSIDNVQLGEQRTTLELRDWRHTPEESLVRNQVTQVVQEEIGRLPSLFASVLVLREIEQRPMPEVAATLGVTVAAAKSRLLRARRELRNRIERHCGRSGGEMPLCG